MKPVYRAAFVAALLCSTAVVLAPVASFAADKLSNDVAKPLSEATKAVVAKDYPTALAKVKEAQATSDRTAFDDYKINAVLAYIEIQQNDLDAAEVPAEAAADSPALPPEEKNGAVSNAFQLAFRAKHYDKAISYGQQLQALNAMDPTRYAMMSQAYYNSKDNAHAQQFAQMSIDASKAAGQTPNEFAMEVMMVGQAGQHNEEAAKATLESLALDFNRADTWGQLIDNAIGGKNVKDIDALFLLRLKMLVPDAMRAEDYTSLASVADQQSYSTEAYDVLQKGIARGKISAAQAGPTYAHARNGASQDQHALASIAASAERAKSGNEDIKLAEDYWGYGRFADAEVAARRAIGKGGMKDPGEGPMLLGMLLVVEGKYDDAIQTLDGISAASTHGRTAHLWSLYAQAQKKAQAKAAQGAAAPAPH